MPLVGQICESNVASKLSSHDISQITRGLSGSFGILGADSLRGDLRTGAHGIGTVTVRGGGLSIRHRRSRRSSVRCHLDGTIGGYKYVRKVSHAC